MDKEQTNKALSKRGLTEIDVKAGKLTYGQRNDMGELLASDKSADVKFIECIKILYGFRPTASEYKDLIEVFSRAVEGMEHWARVESIMLKYDYTPEEIQAGVKDYAEKVGVSGTVMQIAKDFGQDPDIILKWEYAKVFLILLNDLEKAKYKTRFDAVLAKKYKTK